MLSCNFTVRHGSILLLLAVFLSACRPEERIRIYSDPALRPYADSLAVRIQAASQEPVVIEILERSSEVLCSRVLLGDTPDILLHTSLPSDSALSAADEERVVGSDTVCCCRLYPGSGTGRTGIPPADLLVGQLSRPGWNGVPDSLRLVADFYPQLSEYLQHQWVDGAWMWMSTCRRLGGTADTALMVPVPDVHRLTVFSHDPWIQELLVPR